MLLLYFLAAGLLLGRATGGRFTALGDVQIRWWGLALGGLLFQVLLFSEPVAMRVGGWGPPLYVASTAVVLLALLRNLALPGFAVLALGAVLNLLVIVANGGQMPADPLAFAALNGLPVVPVDFFSNSELAAPDTFLPFLGDIFFLPRPLPFANVFSIGDLLIGLGAVVFLVRSMHRRPALEPVTTAALGLDGRVARGV